MRAGTLLCIALFLGCTNTPSGPPDSVRERLESDGATALVIAPSDSAGSITAQKRTSGGAWEAGVVALTVRAGELVATADARGAITIERLSVDLGPIEIPKSVLGYAAQLDDVHLASKRPVGVTTTWTGDDAAIGTAPVDLELSWSLTIDGKTSPLGAPSLPAVPIELELTGTGAVVHAEARALSAGVLWSWADLIKLEDLHLILAAATVQP